MILADKIIHLRKKSGMSQEELANELNVSRQAVSKWEGAQSIPDLDKIILISKLFGVSTDYLLRDELDNDVNEKIQEDESSTIKRKVSLEMANDYIEKSFHNAKLIALGVSLCILSPVLLILLAGISEYYGVFSENLAAAIGMIALFLFVGIAVALFITCDHKVKDYDFLNHEIFETSYGVTGKVKEQKKELDNSTFRMTLIGIILCVFSVVPLIISAFLENDMYCIYGVVVMFVLCSIGTFLIVTASTRIGALDRLLQEGDFTKKNKKVNPLHEAFSTAYWLIATAIYLGWSFLSNDWQITWIVWAIAGVLYGACYGILKAITNKNN